MDILEHKVKPALFISRDGAAKAGMKVLVKLPRKVKLCKVIGPVQEGGDAGYHLLVVPSDPTEKARRLTYAGLELLI